MASTLEEAERVLRETQRHLEAARVGIRNLRLLLGANDRWDFSVGQLDGASDAVRSAKRLVTSVRHRVEDRTHD